MSYEVTCPHCGSAKIAEVIYGMPDYDDELEKKLEAGEVILEGCCIPMGVPLYPFECRDCGERFGDAFTIGDSPEDPIDDILVFDGPDAHTIRKDLPLD